MKKAVITLAYVLLGFFSQAQRTCTTHDLHTLQSERDHFYLARQKEIETHTQKFIELQKVAQASQTKITIPVVVHVVYNTAAQNISLAQIQSQIEVLNKDFSRKNTDTTSTWSQAADVGIEFVLASVDPNGNTTNGITRTTTSKTSFSYITDDIKSSQSGGINSWPTHQYLNIWVGKIGGNILGYATYPGTYGSYDGVVIDYRYFGTTGTATWPFNLGRTGTHEVGHWLNLIHIWGDGACGVDDNVADTPPSDAPNYYCPTNHNSCNSLDMVANFMDYSDDACMNLFTTGQKTRMRALFSNGGARQSLLSSPGLGNTSIPLANCNDGIKNGDETGIDCGGSSCAPCNVFVCDKPQGLKTTSYNKRSETLSWDAMKDAKKYEVRIKQIGAKNWKSSFQTTSTSVTANGLKPNKNYEWQVRTVCQGGSSSYAEGLFVAGKNAARSSETNEIRVYPNPSNGKITIQLGEIEKLGCRVDVYNLNGALVFQKEISNASSDATIDVSTLPDGLYLLRLTSNGVEHFKKISIRH